MEVILRHPVNKIEYELSVLLSADSFFYGLHDANGTCIQKEKIVGSIPTLEQVKPSSDAIISAVDFIVDNSHFCLSAKSKGAKSVDIYEFLINSILTPDRRGYELMQDEHPALGTYVNYLVKNTLLKDIDTAYGDVRISHLLSVAIEMIDTDLELGISCIVVDYRIFLIAQIDGQIINANHYQTNEDTDRLYYLTLMYQSLDHQSADIPIELIVDGERSKPFVQMVERYYDLIKVSGTGKISGPNAHRYLQLLSI